MPTLNKKMIYIYIHIYIIIIGYTHTYIYIYIYYEHYILNSKIYLFWSEEFSIWLCQYYFLINEISSSSVNFYIFSELLKSWIFLPVLTRGEDRAMKILVLMISQFSPTAMQLFSLNLHLQLHQHFLGG